MNDRLDGPIDATNGGRTDPIAVTWCPLCGSAVVYDRVVDRRTLTFGVSGKLADDDVMMYDRETDSEWEQSTGVCIAGPHEGERLCALTLRVDNQGVVVFASGAGLHAFENPGFEFEPGATDGSGPMGRPGSPRPARGPMDGVSPGSRSGGCLRSPGRTITGRTRFTISTDNDRSRLVPVIAVNGGCDHRYTVRTVIISCSGSHQSPSRPR